jgi:nucleobase:cation symporter-1, NCS1 family
MSANTPTASQVNENGPGSDEIVELKEDVSDSIYYNKDIAPTTRAQRKWRTWDVAALWVGMSACIPSYMLASGLIKEGMDWLQALGTIILGNLIVLLPMVLNAHAGTKYGIPYPVYCRASFGVRGANIPALLRAMVACGWFGIQTWIGGKGLYVPIVTLFPSLANSPVLFGDVNLLQFICFMAFWALNMWVIYRGIESIRLLMVLATPILILVPVALLVWAWWRAGGVGPILSQPSAFGPGGERSGEFWMVFFPQLTGMVGFWATLALNIPDFSRYAKSQKAQALGQALGLPTTMGLYAFIGVFVTSATVLIYGEKFWDPLDLLAKFNNPVVVVVSMLALAAATLSTNIAANVVGPANDFSHVWPKVISFRTGGLITGVIGIVMQPWRLLADPKAYIFDWLLAYGSLLGAIGGILIVDYFIIRRAQLNLPGLYRRHGPYWYDAGFNWRAIAALAAGIAPCVPGFLSRVQLIEPVAFWSPIYHYAWFISLAAAGLVYAVLMLVSPPPAAQPTESAVRQ